ncbi:MAG: hypothetical protein ACRD9W_07420, partial [Terriglobia bacterium]
VCGPRYNYVAAAHWFRGENVEFSRINAVFCHTGVVGHFITMVSTLSDCRAYVTKGIVRPGLFTSLRGTGSGAEN